MPYVNPSTQRKFRLLIRGMPSTGKTTSLYTCIYGPYEPDSSEGQAYASQHGHKMIIVNCPGELGVRSLIQTEFVTCYYYEADQSDNSAKWSVEALKAFNDVLQRAIAEKPHFLVCEGMHSLWDHLMNRTTEGEYLQGTDLNTNPRTGNYDPYRSARFHSQTHNAFGQYIAALYNSAVPVFIATIWEDWQAGTTEQEAGKKQAIEAVRYLWPALPGKMGQGIVGRFDASVSARIERRCLHTGCEYTENSEEHYVWQFLPKGDVRGVGIKGLRKITEAMRQKPFIHQDYTVLQKLMSL